MRERNGAAALAFATAMCFCVTDAKAQRGQQRTHDDRQPVGLDRVFYDMARQIPGFAGFWFDSTHTLIVSLTNPATHGAEAIDVVRRFFDGSEREQPLMRLGPAVTYSFRQLYDWKAAYFVSPPRVGLTSADVCENLNLVCVGIEPGRSIAKAYENADRLGIPRGALLVREEPSIRVSKRDTLARE